MSIVFYAGSGSPPSWKVWLTLEHKQVEYQLELLSFQAREHKTPAFLAVNPRGMVPALTDGDLALRESTSIVEYLEEKWPERPLLPRDLGERARVRHLMMEADLYMYKAMDELGDNLRSGGGPPDLAQIDRGRSRVSEEAAWFADELRGPFLAGEAPTLADFTLYPMLALVRRITTRLAVEPADLGPRLGAWMQRIEGLPYFDKTYPPHWRE